jgi:hypothetical protein
MTVAGNYPAVNANCSKGLPTERTFRRPAIQAAIESKRPFNIRD